MRNSQDDRDKPTSMLATWNEARRARRGGNRNFIAITCAALVLTAACQRAEEPIVSESTGEFDWARTALERNPSLEVVAADSESEVFTVRNKNTGEVLALQLSEIAAAPIAQLDGSPAPVASAPPPEAPSSPAEPAGAPPAAAEEPPERTAAAPAPQQEQESSTAGQTPGYTIERSDGQVRVSGPGVSIVSSGAPSTRSPSGSSQRAIDPIICEGRRMLQLDSRDIYVEGTAITARGGCELYITNSRVIGTTIGVLIEDATVHISNSYVEGGTASFVANDRASVFLRSSTFQGVSRRDEQATVQDQGGNRWR